MMNKKKSLKINYLYNLAYQMLAIMVPLITTPYIARILGAAKIGDFAYTSAVVSYFGIVAVLGTSSYAQREIAFHQNDKAQRSKIFYEILFLRGMMTLAVGLVYAIVLLRKDDGYRMLYLIQLCTVFSWAADISWFFQGMEDFKATVLRNTGVKLMSVALILLLVKTESDLWIYAGIVCGTALAGNILLWPFLREYVEQVSWKKLQPVRHLRGSLELFAPVVSIQIYTVLDQTMLGSMIDTTQVGYYVQAQKIVKLVSTILYSLTAVLMPRMSVVLADRNMELANTYYKKTINFSMMLILPMMSGLILSAHYLVPVFFGEGYEACIPLIRIFSLLFITQGIGQIAGTLLISMTKQRQYTIAVTSGAVLNAACNAFLIPRMGAEGAAAASVAAELCVELMMLFSIRSIFCNRVIVDAGIHYLIPTILMSTAIILVERVLEVSIVSLACIMATGMAVYGFVLMLRKDPFLCEQLKR